MVTYMKMMSFREYHIFSILQYSLESYYEEACCGDIQFGVLRRVNSGVTAVGFQRGRLCFSSNPIRYTSPFRPWLIHHDNLQRQIIVFLFKYVS